MVKSKNTNGIEINKKNEDVENISFRFPVIPFVALNPMDNYLELETNMEFYHNLILAMKCLRVNMEYSLKKRKCFC